MPFSACCVPAPASTPTIHPIGDGVAIPASSVTSNPPMACTQPRFAVRTITSPSPSPLEQESRNHQLSLQSSAGKTKKAGASPGSGFFVWVDRPSVKSNHDIFSNLRAATGELQFLLKLLLHFRATNHHPSAVRASPYLRQEVL